MGQKVNPNGMRIGINKNWNSKWYADGNEYHVFLNQDIKIREYIEKQSKAIDGGVSYVEIERKKNQDGKYIINIDVYTCKYGVMLGKDGDKVKEMTKCIESICNQKGNVKINVKRIEEPNLDARLIAQNIARQLEERASFRTAQKKAIKEVMRAKAVGCRTLLSGRLGGAEIARSEGYKEGKIPLQTLRSDIDFAVAEAATIYGKIGVKVWICRGDVVEKKDEEKEGD